MSLPRALVSKTAKSITQRVMEVRGKAGPSDTRDTRKHGRCVSSERDEGGDLLHNLLGVETDAINQMLDSAQNAAALLGVGKTQAK